ncbi:MAG: helix-turn-helix domain-containing protein [Sphingomonadaceae bacterium]
MRRVMRREVGRVSQRAHMILLSAQRKTVPEIAAIFDTTPVTVRFWLRRFEAEGMAGLYDQPRPGRPTKAGAVESPI